MYNVRSRPATVLKGNTLFCYLVGLTCYSPTEKVLQLKGRMCLNGIYINGRILALLH